MSRGLKIAGIALGAGVGAAFLAPNFFNPTRTTAVQSIEQRYTSGGASPSGEKAVATKRGDDESVYTGAESVNQERLRAQKEDMWGSSNTQAPKANNKVYNRAPKEDRPVPK